jgi:putative ABC transport system ATP-binding protein
MIFMAPLPPPDDSLVDLRALSKSYPEGSGRRRVLHDLQMRIGAGEIVALVGRSGCGKSTLLNLISGIDAPTSGTVRVAGTDLTDLSERQRTLFRRRHIGFIFQFFNLIPTLTVLENLLLPLELQGTVAPPAQRRQAEELLAAVGLADRAGSYPDRLSGGEQQRIAIARAVVHRPQLLLADEPTGNLDTESGQMVLELLQRLVQAGGLTLLLVTHSAEVAAIAGRVLTLREGRLLEDRR